ncbi:MAG TPA: FAD-dependent oxidoreductase [Acetobacteraceae bacterium]|nr:FAD-dependent oxidoreductase [Acetobacteraceae bacterium]
MAEESSELPGPDFAAGIEAGAVADGAMLLGHAGGEAVLLARRGDEFFAVGASCSHYHGPLAEGLMVGETVRCPWHHACFSLRTGAALRAPALDPLPCWQVERAGQQVFVRGRRAPAAPAPPPATASTPRRIVIVGGGAAGNAAAEGLRAEGYGGEITLVGAEPALPCDRPNLSKDFLAGSAPEEWVFLRSADFYRERGITLALGAKAVGLDPGARSLRLADGRMLPWDALLLATGAVPRRLPVPGGDLPHVFTLRSLADCRAIIARAGTARAAVVVGASFIGLEAAASLATRGLSVAVVAPEAVPMAGVLGPELGAFLKALHEAHGVAFHLGTRPQAITERVVRLADGSELPADLVLVGIGVKPDTSLAEAAGLAVDDGVLVDEFLASSAPGIFAAGDIARWPDWRGPDRRGAERMRIEHWVVAERQGKIAAGNMLGLGERCDIVPFFWTQQYDVSISYVGHAPRWDRVELAGLPEARDCRAAYFTAGRKSAVATIFRDLESLEAEAAFEREFPPVS